MSIYSPCPVRDFELVDRAVFSIHFNNSNGLIKPQIFSHAFSKGCSVQRGSLATEKELVRFITNMLERKPTWAWHGMVSCEGADLRKIRVETSPAMRALCVYDTAESDNVAHAEFGVSSHVALDEDQPYLRKQVLDAFGSGHVIPPEKYKNGTVWNALPSALRARGNRST